MNAATQLMKEKRALKHKGHLDWFVVGIWAVSFLMLLLAWADYLTDVGAKGLDYAERNYGFYSDFEPSL